MQVFALQILGSAFFYIISIYLPKNDFGAISFMTAISLLIVTILGMGLEQVVVRRIAASSRSNWAGGAFFLHSFIGSVLSLGIVALVTAFMPKSSIYTLLPWFFASQCIIFTGIPLKQYLNAKEMFTPYGIIALISGAGKIVGVFLLAHNEQLTIRSAAILLVCAALFELVCLFGYTILKTPFSFSFKIAAYKKLLAEARMQYVSVLFDMSLSRIDWILLGIITSGNILADYSFAYRAFEIARLPVNIIGPVILPRLSRTFSGDKTPDNACINQLNAITSIEVFVAGGIVLGLNILWIPVVSFITHNKYGQTNAVQFMLLSLCVPLMFLINLLWSVSFSARKYKQAARITIFCAIFNIALNLWLIPQSKGNGAALAFLLTTLLQFVLYYKLVAAHVVHLNVSPLIICILLSAAAYYVVGILFTNTAMRFITSLAVYFAGAALTGNISKRHLKNFNIFLCR